MDFNLIFAHITAFLITNKIIATILGLIFLYFLLKKTMQTFRFMVFLVIMVTILHFLNLLGGAMFQGSDNKNSGTEKSTQQLE